jgi:hypothetical protein
MAVTRLTPGGSARLAPGLLKLNWQVSGATRQNELELAVEALGRPGSVAAGIQSTGSGQALIAALPEAVRVVARRSDGGHFPPVTRLDVQVELRVGQADGGQFVLPTTDVSGTTETELFRLMPREGFAEFEVSPAPTAVVNPPADTSLLQRTVYSARRLIGGDGQLPAAARRELVVAVDRSASMLPLIRSGVRRDLLELLLGVSQVLSGSRGVPVWQLGRVPRQVRPALSPDTLDRYDDVLGRSASTEGTVVAPLLSSTAGSVKARVVVVVTDGVPADIDGVTAALAEPAVAGGRTSWHVLALARSLEDPAVRATPWRDELGPLRAIASEQLTVSSIAPGNGDGWLGERLADDDALDDVVAALPFWWSA